MSTFSFSYAVGLVLIKTVLVCIGILVWLHKAGESGKVHSSLRMSVRSMKHFPQREIDSLDLCERVALANSNHNSGL